MDWGEQIQFPEGKRERADLTGRRSGGKIWGRAGFPVCTTLRKENLECGHEAEGTVGCVVSRGIRLAPEWFVVRELPSVLEEYTVK